MAMVFLMSDVKIRHKPRIKAWVRAVTASKSIAREMSTGEGAL